MNKAYAVMSLFIAAIVLAGCATSSKEADQGGSVRSSMLTSDDAKAVQGNWKPSKAEMGGQAMPDVILKIITLKLDKGQYEVFVGDEPDRGTYVIDPTTNPKSMTVTGTVGPNVGKTFPAIYELNGDTLRICYDLLGAKLPTDFKTTAGTKLYLVTYNRTKG